MIARKVLKELTLLTFNRNQAHSGYTGTESESGYSGGSRESESET